MRIFLRRFPALVVALLAISSLIFDPTRLLSLSCGFTPTVEAKRGGEEPHPSGGGGHGGGEEHRDADKEHRDAAKEQHDGDKAHRDGIEAHQEDGGHRADAGPRFDGLDGGHHGEEGLAFHGDGPRHGGGDPIPARPDLRPDRGPTPGGPGLIEPHPDRGMAPRGPGPIEHHREVEQGGRAPQAVQEVPGILAIVAHPQNDHSSGTRRPSSSRPSCNPADAAMSAHCPACARGHYAAR